jgi:Transposase IS200 like
MADTFSSLNVHCVFSTKNRQPLLVGEIKERFWAFMGGIAKQNETISYIQNQLEHHRLRSFQEEYVSFLKKHGIGFVERYLWD